MIASGELAQHAGYSLRRVALGFAIGAAAGLVVGSAMGLSRRVDDYVRPLFTAIAQVPALAWIHSRCCCSASGRGSRSS